MFVEEEVARICEKAYLKYDFIKKDQDGQEANAKICIDHFESQDKHIKYKLLYHDLQQQITYENKLNLSITNVLENKISDLIAENTTLKT